MSPKNIRALGAYAIGLAVVALASLIAWLLLPYFTLVNIAMIYILAVVFVAFFTGRGPSVLASLAASVSFGLFYVPPRFVLTAEESQYLLTLSVMLGLSVLISNLTARSREKALEAASKQAEQATLYRYTRELAAEPQPARMTGLIARLLADTWAGQVTLYQPEPQGGWQAMTPPSEPPALAERLDQAWAGQAEEVAEGPLYLPLNGVAGPVAVAFFSAPDHERMRQSPDFLAAMLTSGALALERARYGEEAEAARMHVEAERLRNSLLSAVSHDLRTPLAIIVGAASSLAEQPSLLSGEAREQLQQVVLDESIRMKDLVENLLDMARLEAGPVSLNKDWQFLDEVLGVVLKTMRPRLGGRTLQLSVAEDLPLLRFDSALIERVLVNLLENAIKYTPATAQIQIKAEEAGDALCVCVSDNGPGLGEAADKVFNKFWRAKPEGNTPGAGLGLSICRSIIEAHDGRIWAGNEPGGGAHFCFTLPRGPEEAPGVLPQEVL